MNTRYRNPSPELAKAIRSLDSDRQYDEMGITAALEHLYLRMEGLKLESSNDMQRQLNCVFFERVAALKALAQVEERLAAMIDHPLCKALLAQRATEAA